MSIRRSLAWSFSQEFGQNILRFASSIVIARLLTPDEVGVFALGMAAYFLISSLRELGVGSYLIREASLDQDKIRTAFGISLVMSWTLGVLILSIRHYLGALYETPGIADVLVLVSASFFVSPFGQPANALLMREMRFALLHHITLASTAIGIAVTVALAALGFSYMALAWGMVATTVLRSLLLIAARPEHLTLVPSFRYWREVLSFGGFLTGTSLVGTINVQGNTFILGGLINPGAAALLERAVQIPFIIRRALFAPVGRVLFPAFSEDIRDGVRLGPSILKLISANSVIVWPAFLTIGILAVPIIEFLFGEKWRVAGQILPYILLSQAALVFLPQPEQVLVPYGRVKPLFYLRLFGTATGLMFAAIGAMHSLELFAMLRPVQAAIFTAASYLAMRGFLDVSVKALLLSYAKSAIVSLVSGVPAIAAVSLYGSDVPVAMLLVTAALAPIFWLSGVFIVRHDLSREIRTVATTSYRAIASRQNMKETSDASMGLSQDPPVDTHEPSRASRRR